MNVKDSLAGISWEQATTKVHTFNTIAVLTYHIHYYVAAILKVLQGGPLEAKDEYSFAHPPIQNQEDWERLVEKTLDDAATLVPLVEQIPEALWPQNFVDEKYGSYYRNLHGLVEHTHYHLGQIVLLKKWLTAMTDKS